MNQRTASGAAALAVAALHAAVFCALLAGLRGPWLHPVPTAFQASILPAPMRDAVRVPGGPGAGFPDTERFYPTAARRLEEQGVSVVRVCVDASGRLTAAPSTARSSGHARLDEGALQLARSGSGHYRPSTENGRPVSTCYEFGVRFQLRN